MKKTVLLTGGTGFIGSHCAVALLDAGYKVILVDNFCNSHLETVENIKRSARNADDLEFFHVDLAGATNLVFSTILLVYPVDAVIHLAAHKSVPESLASPLKYYDNNLVSLLHVLEAMEENKVHNIVFSSSATVYGSSRGALNEACAVSPTNPYGRTKAWGEQIVHDTCAAWAARGAPAHGVSLRYMNPYGSHDSGMLPEKPKGPANNLFPVVCEVVAGKRTHVDVYGSDYPTRDGTGERDFVHVVDVADAHVKAVNKMLGGDCAVYDVYNVGSGVGRTVLEVIEHVKQLHPGASVPHRLVDRRPGDIASLVVDIGKAKSHLGWTPKRFI